MELRAVSPDLAGHDTPLLVLPVFLRDGDAELPELPGALAEALPGVFDESLDADGPSGLAGRCVLHHTRLSTGPRRVLFVGVGELDDLTPESYRRLAARGVRHAEELRLTSLTVYSGADAPVGVGRLAQSLAEGAALAAWRFRELKTGTGGVDDTEEPVTVAAVDVMVEGEESEGAEGVRVGRAVARGENFARTLQSRPGNIATPTHLAEEASRIGGALGLGVTIFGPDRLLEERMHAILAVAQGSEQEPRLIVLEHRGGKEGEPPLVLVGKGLTFDAGGISLKPSKGMEDMKFDMSAGAAVLGAMHAVAELGIPRNVVGIVPSSENLISGKALKPGDVIHTRSGKTVEVTNTDAEGRLLLSDALDYARSFEPEAVVDCATLTGAVVVGLGHHASGVLGTDDDLVEELREAGEVAGERCWPLPLWDEYRKQLSSETADMNNVGGRPAGTITAACFLSEFVGEAPWAHLDIAGTAYGTEPLPYQRKGGYGIPTRLLVEWVRSRAG